MPGASLSSSSLALLPSTATCRHLCREDRGVVVAGVAGEDRGRLGAGDEGGELDVF